MLTVAELISKLVKNFPTDAKCYAYEGEICGLIIMDRTGSVELGHILCGERGGGSVVKTGDSDVI